nr:MAG TPA: hypothetical protein [Caudoviricetes sp.]
MGVVDIVFARLDSQIAQVAEYCFGFCGTLSVFEGEEVVSVLSHLGGDFSEFSVCASEVVVVDFHLSAPLCGLRVWSTRLSRRSFLPAL